MEIWKQIIGYEGFYEVSNNGNVRSMEREIEQRDINGNLYIRKMKSKTLSKNKTNGNGYRVVTLCKGSGENKQITMYTYLSPRLLLRI